MKYPPKRYDQIRHIAVDATWRDNFVSKETNYFWFYVCGIIVVYLLLTMYW